MKGTNVSKMKGKKAVLKAGKKKPPKKLSGMKQIPAPKSMRKTDSRLPGSTLAASSLRSSRSSTGSSGSSSSAGSSRSTSVGRKKVVTTAMKQGQNTSRTDYSSKIASTLASSVSSIRLENAPKKGSSTSSSGGGSSSGAGTSRDVTRSPQTADRKTQVGGSSGSTSRLSREPQFGLLKPSSSAAIPGLTQKEHGKWDGPFFFVQMADTQFGMTDTLPPRDVNGHSKYSKDELVEMEVGMIQKAVDAINRLKPAFVVLCGDMIDIYPDVKNQEKKRYFQLKTVQDCLGRVDASIPLVCTCGNHDMGNRPNFHTINWYREKWGHDYFSFWVRGVCCVVLNSQLYKQPEHCREYAKEQEEWLSSLLKATKKARPKAVIAFSHIPPFIKKPTEPNAYFNWSEPSRTNTMDALINAGCKSWFCGHYHRNSVGTYRCMEVVTTGAVGVNIFTAPGKNPLETEGVGGGLLDDSNSGLRIVKLGAEGAVSHQWKSFAQLKKMKLIL